MSGRGPSPSGVALAAALTAALAGLSRFPYAAESSDRGVLRLSWRYTPPPGEDCRRPTPSELADLPVHMRNPNACLRVPRTYRLTLSVDDVVLLDKVVRPAGARRDRPLFVYRELSLSAGEHFVDIRFEETDRPPTAPPRALSWTGSLPVEPHEVIVIDYDPVRGVLDRVGPQDTAP